MLTFLSKYCAFVLKPMIIGLLIILVLKLVFYFLLKRKSAKEISQFKFLFITVIIIGTIGLFGSIVLEQIPTYGDTSGKNFLNLISSLSLIFYSLALSGILFFTKGLYYIKKGILWIGSQMILIAGSYILVFLFLFLFQNTYILNQHFLFQPATITEDKAASYLKENIDEMTLVTPDRVELKGWFIRNSAEEKMPLLIYFGGSSSDISNLIPYFDALTGWDVALVNYRGYGLSGGTPTESTFLSDSLFIYDTLSGRTDIDTDRIVVMGWRLGANIAGMVSSQLEVAGSIVIAPSNNETHWFQSFCFPYIPMQLFRTHYFDVEEASKTATAPLLLLLGGRDENNPPELGRKVGEQWNGEVQVIEYENEDHQLLFHENKSWDTIQEFLREISKKPFGRRVSKFK